MNFHPQRTSWSHLRLPLAGMMWKKCLERILNTMRIERYFDVNWDFLDGLYLAPLRTLSTMFVQGTTCPRFNAAFVVVVLFSISFYGHGVSNVYINRYSCFFSSSERRFV